MCRPQKSHIADRSSNNPRINQGKGRGRAKTAGQGQSQGSDDNQNKKQGSKGSKGDDQSKKEKDDKKDKAAIQKQQQDLPTLTVHLVPVNVGRDYGNATEVLNGLNAGQRIIESPNDQVQENAKVKGQLSKQNPANLAPGHGSAQNANSEVLAPRPDAEPIPKQPQKERTTRGPGH